jgi:hypothetical protein
LGGTPTAGTLQALATGGADGGPYPALVDPNRQSFVVLLTDGEPNCDANNPHDCTMATCECTLYQGVAPTQPCPGTGCACGTAPGGFCALGCIDTTGVVQAITALRNIQVKTVVIGFGLETQPDGGMGTGFAPPALQAMAIAGGAPRTCPTGSDAECGVGTCDPGTKVCTLGYYQANNGSQLLAVLQQVVRQF